MRAPAGVTPSALAVGTARRGRRRLATVPGTSPSLRATPRARATLRAHCATSRAAWRCASASSTAAPARAGASRRRSRCPQAHLCASTLARSSRSPRRGAAGGPHQRAPPTTFSASASGVLPTWTRTQRSPSSTVPRRATSRAFSTTAASPTCVSCRYGRSGAPRPSQAQSC